MFKSISKFINSHPIGQMFRLGEKTAAWKKVAELKPGMKIAIAENKNIAWDEIVSVRKLGVERVWDIEVEGTHNFVGNGIVAHNTAGLLMRAGASSLQLSSSATSTTADIQLAAADRIDLFAGSLSLQTSSTTAGELKLMSKGSLILDTSGGTGDLIMTKLNTLGYVCTTAAGVVTAGGATCSTSDIRLKEDIHPLSQDMDVLESLEKLRGVSFTWDQTNPANAGAPTGRQVGMIAQEVEQVLPALVSIGSDGYRRLDYAKMTGYLVEVAKAQQEEIASLASLATKGETFRGSEATPSATVADLDSLRARVTQLEDLTSLLAENSNSGSADPSAFGLQPSSFSLSGSYMETEAYLGSSLVSPLAETKLTLDASTDTVHILGDTAIGGTLTVGLITIDDLDASINSIGETLKIQNQALAGVEFLGGKIVMTKTGDMEILGDLGVLGDLEVGGDLIVGGTVAGAKIEILEAPAAAASIGEAVIPAGQTEAVIYSIAVTANSKVFVAADRPMAIGARVNSPGRFTIELAEPTPAPLKVSWWIVN